MSDLETLNTKRQILLLEEKIVLVNLNEAKKILRDAKVRAYVMNEYMDKFLFQKTNDMVLEYKQKHREILNSLAIVGQRIKEINRKQMEERRAK